MDDRHGAFFNFDGNLAELGYLNEVSVPHKFAFGSLFVAHGGIYSQSRPAHIVCDT